MRTELRHKQTPEFITPPKPKMLPSTFPFIPRVLAIKQITSANSQTKQPLPKKKQPRRSDVKKQSISSKATKPTLPTMEILWQAPFYYAADDIPSLPKMFPSTSFPKTCFTTLGTTLLPQPLFQKLLVSRLRAAKTFLRKQGLVVSQLPTEFVKYTSRLITRCAKLHYATQTDDQPKKMKQPKKTNIKNTRPSFSKGEPRCKHELLLTSNCYHCSSADSNSEQDTVFHDPNSVVTQFTPSEACPAFGLQTISVPAFSELPIQPVTRDYRYSGTDVLSIPAMSVPDSAMYSISHPIVDQSELPTEHHRSEYQSNTLSFLRTVATIDQYTPVFIVQTQTKITALHHSFTPPKHLPITKSGTYGSQRILRNLNRPDHTVHLLVPNLEDLNLHFPADPRYSLPY